MSRGGVEVNVADNATDIFGMMLMRRTGNVWTATTNDYPKPLYRFTYEPERKTAPPAARRAIDLDLVP